MSLAENIKRYRTDRKMSQEDFQRPRKKSRKRVVIGILIGILLIILFAAALVVHRYPQVLDRIRQEYHMGQKQLLKMYRNIMEWHMLRF